MTSSVPSSGFIVSPRYDTLLFTASLAAPLVLWAAFSLGLMTGVAVYVAFQLVFNLPHNFQTWTMSVLDEEDRAKNGRRYAVAALVIMLALAVPMVLSPDGVYPWVRDALIYWGYYHLVRQHYGFQRLYERKMGGVSDRESWWYGRYLDAVSYLPLLIRFRDPELMTIRVGESASTLHHPALPGPVALGLLGVYGAAIVAAAVHHAWAAARGRKVWVPRALLLLSVTACFALAALVVSDLIVAIAIVTTFHNIQYLGLVWFHNRNRADAQQTHGNAPIGWLAARRFALYAAVSIVYGLIIFAPRAAIRGTRLAELPLGLVVALHYYVDARLWRFKDYPKRGAWLLLKKT
ncbi:MAG: hypothetical protein IPJ65_39215 [Archangiaceae bacterium]|nr:hypothetical protein [Archangiaceae bacterium]